MLVIFSFILEIFVPCFLTRTHSYNMFGHFKFCITLVGGYLLFHDPLSLNQVSLPELLWWFESVTSWFQFGSYPLLLVWLSGSGDPLHSGRHPVLHSHQADGAGRGQEPPGSETIGRLTCHSPAGTPSTRRPQCERLHRSLFIQRFFYLHYEYFCRRISSWKGLNVQKSNKKTCFIRPRHLSSSQSSTKWILEGNLKFNQTVFTCWN